MADDKDKRVGDLEDELKRRNAWIAELKDEVDELRETQDRLREHIEESRAITENWCETFDMELTDDGWTWKPFWEEYDRHIRDYNALLAMYNALVRDWNAHIAYAKSTRNVGRPLAASPAQVRRVLKLRKGGVDLDGFVDETMGLNGFEASKLARKYNRPPLSLREIAEETSLGLNTVGTIIARAQRTDRTSRKHLARVEPEVTDQQRLARWKRQRRSGNELPKSINNHLKAGAALILEAKGRG
jgi:hypothetical protein